MKQTNKKIQSCLYFQDQDKQIDDGGLSKGKA